MEVKIDNKAKWKRRGTMATKKTSKTTKKVTNKKPAAKKGVYSADINKSIEEKAYSLFLERGGVHGYHLEDWAKAEKLVLASSKKKSPARTKKTKK